MTTKLSIKEKELIKSIKNADTEIKLIKLVKKIVEYELHLELNAKRKGREEIQNDLKLLLNVRDCNCSSCSDVY